MGGWMGTILDVNLTTGEVSTKPLDLDMARQYLGGRGLGARLLWDEVGPEVDALSPANVLIFAGGPLTGTGYQTSNRFSVSTKSPLTGTVLDANSGGFWGMQFKRTGYDALIVRGKAAKPVYIEIKPGTVEIKDAAHLWGKRVMETTALLGQNNNKRNVLCIGPAGENLLRIAAIMNDGQRSLARGGPGAVMGSKNLKAIVVEGKQRPEIIDQEQFKFMLYESRKLLKASPLTSQALPEFGTAVMMNIVNAVGALPTRNYQQTSSKHAEDISGEALTEKYLVKNDPAGPARSAARASPRPTRSRAKAPNSRPPGRLGAAVRDRRPGGDHRSQRPVQRPGHGYHLGRLHHRLRHGTDREGPARQRPALWARRPARPHHRSHGLPRGLGDELAEGSLRLATRYGHPELSMSVKGLEMPAYDPRGMQGQGLLYATSNRGACHMRGNMLGLEVLGLPKLIDRFQVQGKSVLRHPAPELVRRDRLAGGVQVHQHGRGRRILCPRALAP